MRANLSFILLLYYLKFFIFNLPTPSNLSYNNGTTKKKRNRYTNRNTKKNSRYTKIGILAEHILCKHRQYTIFRICSFYNILFFIQYIFYTIFRNIILYQQRWQARPDLCNVFLGQAPCYKSAEGRCRRQRPEAVIIP